MNIISYQASVVLLIAYLKMSDKVSNTEFSNFASKLNNEFLTKERNLKSQLGHLIQFSRRISEKVHQFEKKDDDMKSSIETLKKVQLSLIQAIKDYENTQKRIETEHKEKMNMLFIKFCEKLEKSEANLSLIEEKYVQNVGNCENNGTLIFTCVLCGLSFPNLDHLKIHQVHKHEKNINK